MAKKTKKTKKNYLGKLLRTLIFICALCGMCYSGYNLYTMKKMYDVGTEEYEQIVEKYTSNPYKEENTTNTNSANTNDTDTKTTKINSIKKYPTYININFNELMKVNSDVVAWIRIPDTVIDYPIVQGKDNQEYLHKNIYNKYLYAGTIFINSQNSTDFTDKNTIIYGHNMKDGSMFATLNNYISKESYYKEHKYVQIYTKTRKSTYCIVGYQLVQDSCDRYTIYFNDNQDYIDLLDEISTNTIKKCEEIDINKNIITLSTCHGAAGGTTRLVMHLQKIGSVANDVYSQFYIDNTKKGGPNNGILCYRTWIKHGNLFKQ